MALSAKNGEVLIPFLMTIGFCILAQIGLKLRSNDLYKLLVLLMIGLSFDSALIFFGGMSIVTGELVGGISPLWLVAVWLGFVFTLPPYFEKLGTFSLVLVFALFAPLSYLAAEKIGILKVNGLLVWILMTLFWAGYAIIGRRIYTYKQPLKS